MILRIPSEEEKRFVEKKLIPALRHRLRRIPRGVRVLIEVYEKERNSLQPLNDSFVVVKPAGRTPKLFVFLRWRGLVIVDRSNEPIPDHPLLSYVTETIIL